MIKFSFCSHIWKRLRKFGLVYDDFPVILENVNSLLRNITIDIFKNSKRFGKQREADKETWTWTRFFSIVSAISFIFYVLTVIGSSVYFYVYVFSMVWLVCFNYGKAGNWTAVAVVLSLFSCSITSFTKLVFMKINSNDIKEIIAKFLQCHAQVIPGTRFANNIRKRLRVVKRRATNIWLFGVINGGIYVIIPFLTTGRHFTTDIYFIYGLVPMFESPNFEIATVVNITGIGFGIYTQVTAAAYVLVTVGYIESQMYALSEELQVVWDDSLHFYNVIKHNLRDKVNAVDNKRRLMNIFIRVRLRDITKLHIANINLLHELDKELRATLALEFTFIAFSITAELLGGLENTHLQLPYTVLQIFMDCLAGQRLIDASNNFEMSLYNCEWENFSIKNRKTVLLMLRVSQRTLVLSAGGVAKLGFPCMMMILRTAYSAYTTLKSTLK